MGKPAAKGSVKGSEANDLILEYMVKQNRPYSAVDITTNLHGQIGKTQVVKSLSELADEGKLKAKEYGKQKAYVANQESFPQPKETELSDLDDKITEYRTSIAAGKVRLAHLTNTLKGLTGMETTKQLTERIASLTEEIARKKAKLEQLRDGGRSVTKEERDEVYKKHAGIFKEWKKRRRMCKNIADQILEGYGKGRAAFYEEVGIEDDAEVGVSIDDHDPAKS